MSDTLTLAKKEYNKTDASGKQLLENIFGKDAFQRDFKEIKCFEDACNANGTNADDILPYKDPINDKQEAMNAFAMMCEIVEAINPDFVPDYGNSNQPKWYPWFEWDNLASGFRFNASGYVNVRTHSAGGSRLCSETIEKSNYIGKQFIDIWNKILIKKNQ